MASSMRPPHPAVSAAGGQKLMLVQCVPWLFKIRQWPVAGFNSVVFNHTLYVAFSFVHCSQAHPCLLLFTVATGPAVVEEAASVSAGAEADDAAAGNRKKRRVAAANGSSPAAVGSAPLTLEHTASLSGHVHCVSAVCWPQPDTVFSGGWDHSVRRFDVESSTNTDTYNGSKAVYAVAAPADGSSNVVAFGGSDRVLRVWDTRRVSGEGLAVKAYTAHEGWISAVSWRPESSYQVATGGHDGAVKLWDIRTAVPLGSLQQHKEDAKVLCVGWWGGQTLVSGGSDCKVQLYSLP